MYYFITDHIGNVRVVANASGSVVEESDYLPFGAENVITDTIANNYKFIGMERDIEGTAALDHTLYRQYAPNLARWTTPDPVHGIPANPQTWNRYPYVINDPMTKIDPLGGSHQDYDPYFVGCFPDPFFESLFGGFGCGYSAESKCPPGFEEIYGDPRPDRRGGPAIANLNSLRHYADIALGPLAEEGLLNYQVGPDGLTIELFLDAFNFIGAEADAFCNILPPPYSIHCKIGTKTLILVGIGVSLGLELLRRMSQDAQERIYNKVRKRVESSPGCREMTPKDRDAIHKEIENRSIGGPLDEAELEEIMRQVLCRGQWR